MDGNQPLARDGRFVSPKWLTRYLPKHAAWRGGFVAGCALALLLTGPAPIRNRLPEAATAATLAALSGQAMAHWQQTARLSRFTESTLPPVKPPLVLASAHEVMAQYAARNVRLEDVRQGDADVPPVFLAAFPDDLADLKPAQQRKRVFLQTMLPLVLRANEQIRLNRRHLLQIAEREKAGIGISEADRQFRERMAKLYKVKPGNWDTLLRRVDVVPPSLALAQGAEESGWGTSRFARKGNAVFGQRTYHEQSDGLVPHGRDEQDTFKVAAFDHLYTSVRAYMLNLNTHPAYVGFRDRRASMRQDDKPLNSEALVKTLHRYSERGDAYVDTILTIMRANDLRQFDDAQLGAPDETAARGGNPNDFPS